MRSRWLFGVQSIAYGTCTHITHLTELFVRGKHRRQGVTTGLVRHAVVGLPGGRLRRTMVEPNNAGAIAFYSSIGAFEDETDILVLVRSGMR